MNPHRLTAYILLLVVSIIWAIAGPVIKYVLGEVPPLPFLLMRFGISSLVAIVTFLFTGVHFPKKFSTISLLFVYGFVTSTVTLGLLFLGLNKTTVLEMSLISLTGPLMIAVGGVVFLKEHITHRERIGMGIALVGTVFTIIEPLITGGIEVSKVSADLIIVLYLIANTVSVILAKKLLRQGVSPTLMTNLAFIIGFITILPLSLGQSDFSHLSTLAILGIIFMSVISGNLAYFLANKAQKSIEVSEEALFAYLYPLLSIPLAIVWLHEKVTPIFIVGAVIVAVGVVIAELKK